MTRKEIVLRAIERTGPPRMPINYCNRDFEWSDTLGCGWAPAADFIPPEPGATEWGYAWHALDQTMGQPRTHPLGNWDNIAGYVPPDPFAPGRFDGVAEFCAANSDRFLKFGIGISGFNQATINKSRIQTGFCINTCHHRGGGRFAVRTGNGNAVAKTH